eukprot:TRINITY_DN2499_c0_g1_i1.p1 TRINITY_DN2499_c0_g1~~TRINITY_DN2499_c0_g1_i1.p1  ORF type:complete len:292 (+),score=66.71 TRINITY_DN2499_c0_g1_i1:138-1013(+)
MLRKLSIKISMKFVLLLNTMGKHTECATINLIKTGPWIKRKTEKRKETCLMVFWEESRMALLLHPKKGSIFLFKFIGGKEEKNTITNHYGLKAATKKIHGLGKTELENFSTILYFDEGQLNLRRGDNNKNSNLKPYVQTREFLFSILEDSIILFNEEEINELKKRIDESFPELKENSKRENEDRENEDRDNQERASKKLKCETKKNPWNTKGILKSMNSVNNQINPEYASSDQSILIENHNTCSGDLDFTTTRDSNRVSIYDFLKGPNDLPFFEVSPHDPKVPFKFPLFEN